MQSLSAFYETAPWGFRSEHNFLNAALHVQTTLGPWQLLEATQTIEQHLGRLHKSAAGTYTDRTIDIDILLYGTLVMDATSAQGVRLTIPHPLMEKRLFVMRPLAEIAPALTHPVTGKSMQALLAALEHEAQPD